MRVGSLRPALLSLAVLASLAFFLTCSRYGEIPLVFEQNQGQTDPRVQFLARTSTHTLFLAGNEMVVRAPGSKGAAKDAARIQFRGANANVVPVARERITGAFNYFIGNDPSKWRTNVPGYQRVEYRQFYPGIDLVCYGQGQQLEYDFVVAPGARPQDIRLSVEGEIANGDLLLKNSARMKKPVAYQMSGGSRRLVAASYARRANGEFGFDIGAYDATQPLVIDPVLAYSTFLGGSNFDDTGTAIAVDSAGSAYVTGYSSSVDFPTVPPFENAFGGGLNVFVTKFTPQGNGIVYSTTVGGLSFDQGFGIAIDGSGNAYVTGVTFSNNFPIVGGFQSQLGMRPAMRWSIPAIWEDRTPIRDARLRWTPAAKRISPGPLIRRTSRCGMLSKRRKAIPEAGRMPSSPRSTPPATRWCMRLSWEEAPTTTR